MRRSKRFMALLGSMMFVLMVIGVSSTIAYLRDSGKSTVQASAGNLNYTVTTPSDGGTGGGLTYPDGTPLYGIGTMYPGVPESSQSLIINNTGTTGLKYSVRSIEQYTNPEGALIQSGLANERINVKITAGSTVIYNGKVRNAVSNYSPIIPAGASSTVTLTLTWPISSGDDAYNGAASSAVYEIYAIGA